MNRVDDWRRRLAGARVLAVAAPLLAAVAISAYAWEPDPASDGGSAGGVPWTATAGAAMTQLAAQAARPCSPADLGVTVGAAGAYRGSATQELILTNRAQDACFIPGAPSTTLLFDDGGQQVTAPGQFAATRIDFQPGQSAVLLVGAPGTCSSADPSRSKVATRMALGLPVGGSIQVQGVYLDVQCGQSSVVLLAASDAPAAATGPQSALTGSISAPASAARGQVYRYTVTLANPTDQDIPLSPCPSYSQSLSQPAGDGSTGSSGTWLLNCAAAGAIPAHGRVTFEMQLSVPDTMVAGPAKLFWDLEVPGGLAVGSMVTVQ